MLNRWNFLKTGFYEGIKYPLHRFLLLVTAGKILKVTGIALLGYYGLSAIMPSFG